MTHTICIYLPAAASFSFSTLTSFPQHHQHPTSQPWHTCVLTFIHISLMHSPSISAFSQDAQHVLQQHHFTSPLWPNASPGTPSPSPPLPSLILPLFSLYLLTSSVPFTPPHPCIRSPTPYSVQTMPCSPLLHITKHFHLRVALHAQRFHFVLISLPTPTPPQFSRVTNIFHQRLILDTYSPFPLHFSRKILISAFGADTE